MKKLLLFLGLILFVINSFSQIGVNNLNADTLLQYMNYVCQVHRTATYNTSTTNWDTLKFDTLIVDETVGAWSLGTDSTYLVPPDTGIYEFCGCWHIKNNGGASVDAKFLAYLTNEVGDTAMCSQISETINKDAGEYVTIHYCGSIRAGINCKVRANFKVGHTDIDLDTDADLPKLVAASLKLIKISD